MLARLKLKFYLHLYAFLRYFRDVGQFHPLAEHRNDAGPRFFSRLHAPRQKPLEVNRLDLHRYLVVGEIQ